MEFPEFICKCGHMKSAHADKLNDPSPTDECEQCNCLDFEPVDYSGYMTALENMENRWLGDH